MALTAVDHKFGLPTTRLAIAPAVNRESEFEILGDPAWIAAAKVQGSSATVELSWHNPTPIPFFGYARVYDARFHYQQRSLTGPYADVYVPVSHFSYDHFVIIGALSTSSPVQIPLGSLPSFVVGGELQLQIDLRGNIGMQLPGEPDALAWGNSTVWNDFGTIYLTAQSPTGVQTIPWLETLKQACWFAQEQSAESDVRREITKGIFFETKDYDGGSPTFCILQSTLDLDAVFNITKFVKEDEKYMNCIDGAAMNVVFCESLGFETKLIYYRSAIFGDKSDSFKTNFLKPAGQPMAEYEEYNFTYHCVAYSYTNVYDGVVAHKYNLGGSLREMPVWDWNYLGYAQVNSPPPVYGLIKSPVPWTTTFYSEVKDVIGVL